MAGYIDMLYFAYGSNLNHEQMQRRCKNPQYIKKFFLRNYKLFFCAFGSSYGVANIIPQLGSQVPGGVWEISQSDENELDTYEKFPTKYTKDFFILSGENVMFYIIKKQYSFKPPQKQYIDIINQGYKDCDLDIEYLKKRLRYFNIDL